VGEIDRAAEFYGRALGFTPTVRGYPGALFLSAGGYHHHLGVNTWAGPLAATPDAGDARLLEWTIVAPASAAAASAHRVRDAGYSAVESDDGWVVTDPWGTSLRLRAGGGS
jgi:catechol 2,3-dioxygenase